MKVHAKVQTFILNVPRGSTKSFFLIWKGCKSRDTKNMRRFKMKCFLFLPDKTPLFHFALWSWDIDTIFLHYYFFPLKASKTSTHKPLPPYICPRPRVTFCIALNHGSLEINVNREWFAGRCLFVPPMWVRELSSRCPLDRTLEWRTYMRALPDG